MTSNRMLRWSVGLAAILYLAWLGITAVIPRAVGSPDEAANALFIEQVRQSNSLVRETDLQSSQIGYWHPRSVRVDGTTIKPLSFLGLPLAGGNLEKIFGRGSAAALTPLASFVALAALFMILRRFWSDRWALLGAGLVAVHPVWWQYQTLPYAQNGLFASFLVVAAWRLMRVWDDARVGNIVWFGIAFGAALWFRPIEILWAGPLVAIVLLAQRKWKAILGAAAITAVLQLPWLLIGWSLYQSPLGSGYTEVQFTSLAQTTSQPVSPIASIITPPGGWSWNWLHSFWNYFILMVPAWGLATLVALFFFLKRIASNLLKLIKIVLVSLVLVFAFVYYGSWNLYPLATPSEVGTLASYARYWIPLYVAMVVGMLWVLKRIAASRLALIVSLTALFLSQVVTIIWHPTSGVRARLDQDQIQQDKREQVLALTPLNAAIVAGHMDKVLWPDRVVAFRMPVSDADWQAFSSLASSRAVYVYVTPRQYDVQDVNADLAAIGFRIGEQTPIGGDELWEVRPL